MRLIRGVVHDRATPNIDSSLNMVPVDFVAQAIVTLSLQCPANNAAFNICSPHTFEAKSLFKAIHLVYPLKFMDEYAEWVEGISETFSVPTWVRSLPKLYEFEHMFRGVSWEKLFTLSSQELRELGVPGPAAVPLSYCIADLGGVIPSRDPSPLLPYVSQLSRAFFSFNAFPTPLLTAKQHGVQCPPMSDAMVAAALEWLTKEGYIAK